jgi:hypothetical protein
MSALLGAALFAALPATGRAADLTATPANFASVFAGAGAGDVIHLAGGDYGAFAGGVKPGIVTLQPQAGATVTMAPDMDQAQGIRFVGLRLGLTYMRDSQQIEFVDDTFTATAQVDVTRAAPTPLGILFRHNTFDHIDKCATCQEGRLTVLGDDNARAVGVTIQENHFGGGGESDGVQITGGAYGVRVLGNEFEGILQGDFATHVDPLQLYGSSHTVITGNYFHGDSTGIMASDGADHEDIENNVFVPTTDDSAYPFPIYLGGDNGSTVRHNTLVKGDCDCGSLAMAVSNEHNPSVGTVIRDNVLAEIDWVGLSAPSTTTPEDYNMFVNPAGTILGSHDVRAAPTFFAASPARWSDYGLARRSPGTSAASDGRDMGIEAPARAIWTVPAAARVGTPVALDGSGSQGDEPLACVWSFEKQDGTVLERAPGCRISKVFATAGRAYVRLTVTDRHGQSDSLLQPFTVIGPSTGSGPSHHSSRPAPRRSKWVTIRLHRRFRVAGCQGRVRVTVLRGHRRLAAKTVRLTRTCAYRARLKVRRSRLHGARHLTIRVRAVGGRPDKAKTYRVRVSGR